MQACPVDAIVLNAETGSKDVLSDICVGCKVCTMACPYGTINYNTRSGKGSFEIDPRPDPKKLPQRFMEFFLPAIVFYSQARGGVGVFGIEFEPADEE